MASHKKVSYEGNGMTINFEPALIYTRTNSNIHMRIVLINTYSIFTTISNVLKFCKRIVRDHVNDGSGIVHIVILKQFPCIQFVFPQERVQIEPQDKHEKI